MCKKGREWNRTVQTKTYGSRKTRACPVDMHFFDGCRMFRFALVPLAYLVTQVMTFWLASEAGKGAWQGAPTPQKTAWYACPYLAPLTPCSPPS